MGKDKDLDSSFFDSFCVLGASFQMIFEKISFANPRFLSNNLFSIINN